MTGCSPCSDAAIAVSAIAALQFAGRIRVSGGEFTVGLAIVLWVLWFYLRQTH